MTTISRFHILLDQGLPRDAAEQLRAAGVECTHVGEIGMSAASDTDILEYARDAGRIIVTLDADFHAILVVSGMSNPSVIRIRIEGTEGFCNRRDRPGSTRGICVGAGRRLHDHCQGAKDNMPPPAGLGLILPQGRPVRN